MAISVSNPSTGGTVVGPSGGVVTTNPTGDGTAKTSPSGVAIPTGMPGPPGKSAYELALEAGFVGTEEEWLAEVEGDPGPQGPAGPPGPEGPEYQGTDLPDFVLLFENGLF